MSEKLCPKIILEGTRLTMRTDIAFALNEHPPVLNLDISDNHIPKAADRIADWLEDTGKLWME